MNKIAICVPVYNPILVYLSACFKSIKVQTYTNYNVYVIDDCSSNSEEIRTKCEEYNFNYFRNNENKGIGYNRQLINELKKDEELISYISYDDCWMPTFLEEAEAVMKEAGADVVYSNYYRTDKDGKITEEFQEFHPENVEQLRVQAWSRCCVMFSGILIKKSVFEKTNFKPLRRGEDYLFLLEALRDHNFVHIEKPLAKYRVHDKMGTITEATLLNDKFIRSEARKFWGIENEK